MSIFEYGFMQRAFLVGILLAVITPLIGMTVVLKRMSMVGDALAHASLAGVAIGMLFGINPVAGAGGICVVAALAIEAIRRRLPRYSENAIAIVMSAGIGLAGYCPDLLKTVLTLTAFCLEVSCQSAQRNFWGYVLSAQRYCCSYFISEGTFLYRI